MIKNPRHRNWLRVAVYGEAPIPRDLTGPTAPPKGKKKKLPHWADAVDKYQGDDHAFAKQKKNKKPGKSKGKSESKSKSKSKNKKTTSNKPGSRQDPNAKAKANQKNIQDVDHEDEEDQESGLKGTNPICFRVIREVGDAWKNRGLITANTMLASCLLLG